MGQLEESGANTRGERGEPRELGELALLFCRGLEGKSPQGGTMSALEPP